MISDRNGNILSVYRADDGIWRLRTHPEEIPSKLKRILIAKEDRYFYRHPGVNPFAIARAAFQNIITGKRTSGASTITMQVARMLEPKERTYYNKMKEMFRAVQLELHYSKKEILEMYLSFVPLGGNIEGLKSASLIYYQTPPERLNIAQLFDLILIPTDPNDLRPDRHPERLLQERKRRALPWIEEGLLTKEDSVILWRSPALAIRHQLPRFAPQFCLRIKEQTEGNDEIASSLNLSMQQNVEALLAHHMQVWKQRGVPNGAVIVADNKTRGILAYAGSENFYDAASHGEVNAAKALRSPGSTLKPFLYALQMERGTLTPKTRLLDTPYDAEGFYAENFDGSYSGLVYADEALRRSLNVPMVRLLKSAGVHDFISFASGSGFPSLEKQKDRLGLSIILGGCGVTLEELVSAYSSFANSGIYAPLNFFKSKPQQEKGKHAFSPSTAFMVTEILSGLDRPDLPNNFESSVNLPKVAFKTGTSYGRHDAWCIGYTAEYTIGVWIGDVTNRGIPELSGAKTAAPLLIELFNSLSNSKQKTILKQPDDILTREVCGNSGMLPTRHCSRIIEDLYSVSNTLEQRCEFDKEFLISLDQSMYFCPSCLGNHEYRVAVYQDYPPSLIHFWEKLGTQYKAIPGHNPECTQVFAGDGPSIVSPSDAMTYYLVSQKQEIVFQATSSIDVKEHIWYVDDILLKRQKANAKLFVPLQSGLHKISCADDKGRISSITVTIKYIL